MVSVADRATIEGGLFKNVIDGFGKDGIMDFKSALDMLERLPFKSERVTGVLNELKQNSAVLNNKYCYNSDYISKSIINDLNVKVEINPMERKVLPTQG